MCAIAGCVEPRADRGELVTGLNQMLVTLAHRGPDDRGAWVDETVGVGLGHCRLAIQDLSAAGHQPMMTGDEQLVLAFNGEIYNAEDLRGRLADGEAWRGHSDTEVLLRGLQRWGISETLSRLVGMFAFVASRRRRLPRRDELASNPPPKTRRTIDGTTITGSCPTLASGMFRPGSVYVTGLASWQPACPDLLCWWALEYPQYAGAPAAVNLRRTPRQVALGQLREIRRVIDTGREMRMEARIPIGNSWYWCDTSIQPFRDATTGRSPSVALIIAHDITKYVEATETLKLSEERYRTLVDNLPIGFIRSTPAGKIISANRAALRMYGYASEDE